MRPVRFPPVMTAANTKAPLTRPRSRSSFITQMASSATLDACCEMTIQNPVNELMPFTSACGVETLMPGKTWLVSHTDALAFQNAPTVGSACAAAAFAKMQK